MDEPIWLTDAKKYLGTHEAPGAVDNPVILKWATELGGWIGQYYQHDSIPWCGLFVAHVMQETGFVPAKDPLGARNWAPWGQGLKEPALGAVVVFTREGGGHVAFYVGEDDKTYHTLGGNQSDSVSITRIDKARCIGVRWPAGKSLPTGGRVMLAANGAAVSTNEA